MMMDGWESDSDVPVYRRVKRSTSAPTDEYERAVERADAALRAVDAKWKPTPEVPPWVGDDRWVDPHRQRSTSEPTEIAGGVGEAVTGCTVLPAPAPSAPPSARCPNCGSDDRAYQFFECMASPDPWHQTARCPRCDSTDPTICGRSPLLDPHPHDTPHCCPDDFHTPAPS